MAIVLNLNNITDAPTKQALEQLVEQLNNTEILAGSWDYVEYTVPQSTAVVFQLNHRLKFKPTDIIELHKDATLTSVVYNKDKFTPTTVYFTATGSGALRFLVGKQKRG
jgi:hypothetical protein